MCPQLMNDLKQPYRHGIKRKYYHVDGDKVSEMALPPYFYDERIVRFFIDSTKKYCHIEPRKCKGEIRIDQFLPVTDDEFNPAEISWPTTGGHAQGDVVDEFIDALQLAKKIARDIEQMTPTVVRGRIELP